MELVNQHKYQLLVNQISNTYKLGRQRAAQGGDTHLVNTYWEIGQYIELRFLNDIWQPVDITITDWFGNRLRGSCR